MKGNVGRDFGAQIGNREEILNRGMGEEGEERVGRQEGKLEGSVGVVLGVSSPTSSASGEAYLSELPPQKPRRPVRSAGTPPSLRSASPLPEPGRGRRLGFEELALGTGRGESDFLSPRPTRAGRTPPPPSPHNSRTPGSAPRPLGFPRPIMSRIESLTRARIDRSKELASKVGSETPLPPPRSSGTPRTPAPAVHPLSPRLLSGRQNRAERRSGGAASGERRAAGRGGWGLRASGEGWGERQTRPAPPIRRTNRCWDPGREQTWAWSPPSRRDREL
ncbi:hypothetical protein P7K49_037450 [Saguinus oedipus]|uniref:Uncharacterized protein n=1 Tax=Saguinus oedipus TaxID=9490 RepID=A0ABQ9TI44_SAGOE|nr:hypothetical protein P7K49_037450 [Saguinus oedipus]